MTYLAIENAAALAPHGWKWRPWRRLARIRREPNLRSDQVLLALSANRGLVPRPGDGGRQLPSNKTVSSYWKVRRHDLVFNPMWAFQGGLAVSELDGAVSTAYRVYEFSEDVHPRYAHYFLRSQPAIAQFGLLIRGVTTFDRSVTREDLEGMPLPVPSFGEQKAIARYLDVETARIESLTQRRRKQLLMLKARRRSVVRARMQELSERYGTIPLKRLVECLDGRRVPLSNEERQQRQGPYRYYGASGVIDHIDDWLFDETLVLLGEDGAQLGDPEYDISFVVRGKCWVNNHAHVLRPIHADPDFLALHLSTFDRSPFISGATREKITQDDMNRIHVPYLSAERQSSEASKLSQSQQLLTLLINRLIRHTELLNERRQALITAAVTGRIDIPVAA